MAKIAIVGSRTFPMIEEIYRFVALLPEGTVVVSGGATGADMAAEKAARKRGLEVVIYRPNWNKHGNRAGIIRNGKIIADADACVAFLDINNKSLGTRDSLKRAQHMGLPIWLFLSDGEKILCQDFVRKPQPKKQPSQPAAKALEVFFRKKAKEQNEKIQVKCAAPGEIVKVDIPSNEGLGDVLTEINDDRSLEDD